MEYRQLGASGFKVPVLSFGTGTFGGKGDFSGLGPTDVEEARGWSTSASSRASTCSTPPTSIPRRSEEILGEAIKGRRDQVLISTKATFRVGDGPERRGLLALPSDPRRSKRSARAARHRLHRPLSAARLRRADAGRGRRCATLDDLVRAGKVRYIGCSNFSGWHLMKSLAASERYGCPRYVAHQAYYSLVGRDYEWELMPLGARPGRGRGGLEPARLGPADRQDPPRPAAAARRAGCTRPRDVGPAGRRTSSCTASSMRSTRSPKETGKTVPQIALNWLLQRPTVSTVIDRRPQRGAAAAEPRRGRLEPDAGAGGAGSTRRAT